MKKTTNRLKKAVLLVAVMLSLPAAYLSAGWVWEKTSPTKSEQAVVAAKGNLKEAKTKNAAEKAYDKAKAEFAKAKKKMEEAAQKVKASLVAKK
jgi:hypothetical protein